MTGVPGTWATVGLIARRELRTHSRSRGVALGTAALVAALTGFLLVLAAASPQDSRTTIGLAGQAATAEHPLRASARRTGQEIVIVHVADVGRARSQVVSGELDVLVSGSAAEPRVLVRTELDDRVRTVLRDAARRQVLDAALVRAGLDPATVVRDLRSASVTVETTEGGGPEHGQRFAVAAVLLSLTLLGGIGFGSSAGWELARDRANGVVEVLCPMVRPWHLLAGKLIGAGLASLLRLTVVGVVAVVVASATGLLTVVGAAVTALLWGLVWSVLGFALYATMFAAAAGSAAVAEPRGEGRSATAVEPQGMPAHSAQALAAKRPVRVVALVAFVCGGGLLAGGAVLHEPDGTLATVLSLLPPLSPILIPTRLAAASPAAGELAVAAALTVATLSALLPLAARSLRPAP